MDRIGLCPDAGGACYRRGLSRRSRDTVMALGCFAVYIRSIGPEDAFHVSLFRKPG